MLPAGASDRKRFCLLDRLDSENLKDFKGECGSQDEQDVQYKPRTIYFKCIIRAPVMAHSPGSQFDCAVTDSQPIYLTCPGRHLLADG